MKKNNIKNFIIAIVTVLVVGLIITGSTFAYFQWTTADDQRTNVSVQIEHGSIVMTISPEATSVSGLKPTNNCSTNSRYIDTLVKVENGTGTIAIPSFKLKVRVDKNGTDALTKAALSHINYSVVPITTTVDASGNPVKGVVSSGYSCDNPPFGYDSSPGYSGMLFNNMGNGRDAWSTHLKFESVSTGGAWTHIPNCGDITFGSDSELEGANCGYLPRQYYLEDEADYDKGETNGITFKAYSGGTTYQYFRVYVWIDSGYTATAVGNVVSDPLQNATIYVTWSEESTIQQVEGVFTPGDNYVEGENVAIYALSGEWLWNETPTFNDNLLAYITFSTGSYTFYAINVHAYEDRIYYYDVLEPDTIPPDGYFYYWNYPRTVDFGDTPQEVSQEFYEWFTANAVKQ